MNSRWNPTVTFSLAALLAAAPALAQAPAGAPVAGAQARPAAPRPPSKSPLGRMQQEVLGMKVVVSDMPKSLEFYTRVVGLKPGKSASQAAPSAPPTGSDPAKWPVEYGLNFTGEFSETFFDLLRPSATSKPTPESAAMTTLMFKVADAPAVIRRAKELGYTVQSEAPAVQPGEMSIGFLRDPDGYRIEIIQAASYPAK